MEWTTIGQFATAISTAFVGWQAWETRRNNIITSSHIQDLNKHSVNLNNLNKKKESIKAIKRFNDKIIADVHRLNNQSSTSQDAYKLMVNITLKLNAWSVYLNSNVANNKIIKDTLYKIILNWYYDWLHKMMQRIYVGRYYDITGLIKLLKMFDIGNL